MSEISKREFGEFIRKRRGELTPPVTLRGFAERVGISPTYLSRIERGDFDPPSEDTIRKIAREINCGEDELLALAGKISSDLTEIITKQPAMAHFLRTTNGMSKEKLDKLIAQAEQLKKE